jgi:cysteine protease ATG4
MDKENEMIINTLNNNLNKLLQFSEEKQNHKLNKSIEPYKKYSKNSKSKFKAHILSIKHKFNLFNISNEKITIFSKTYTQDIIDKLIYSIGKIIYLSYKKNFPIIRNEKTNKTYTNDSGWGCMIRCGQMILSRAIYKYYKKLKFDSFEALVQTSKYFLDTPISFDEFPEEFFHMISFFLKNNDINKIESEKLKGTFSPFSLKSICLNGILCNKGAGEWFSDVNMCYLFNLISENYSLFPNLKILSFQSCVIKETIIKNCFSKEKSINENEFIDFDNEKYYFKNMGIVFISVRLGITNISLDYHDSIRKYFLCKESIGILGGIKDLAYYFIGYKDDGELLYLDPHSTKECCSYINEIDFNDKYLSKNIKSLSINKMTTALSFGFIFRNYLEFCDMNKFFSVYMKDFDYPLFGISEKNIDNYNAENLDKIFNMEKDDF